MRQLTHHLVTTLKLCAAQACEETLWQTSGLHIELCCSFTTIWVPHQLSATDADNAQKARHVAGLALRLQSICSACILHVSH